MKKMCVLTLATTNFFFQKEIVHCFYYHDD